jgi:hypothetical protein
MAAPVLRAQALKTMLGTPAIKMFKSYLFRGDSICPAFQLRLTQVLHPFFRGNPMKFLIAALSTAFMLASVPAFAGSHGGGKMDDKKVDCSKKENEKDKACEKKK